MKFDVINKVSTNAVQKATGKSWDEWIKIIDKEGGAKLTHKEIARLLFDKKYIKNGWWCQQVTVGYEYAKGRRVLGETKATGFEVGVSKTFNVPVSDLWSFIFSKRGLKIWMGNVKEFKLEKGFKYKVNTDILGEIRTLDMGKRIRMSHEVKNSPASTLQLYFTDKAEKSSLIFHQEKLQNAKQRELMQKHWKKVMLEIEKSLAGN